MILNKLKLIKVMNGEKPIHIISRSAEQHTFIDIDVLISDDAGDLQEYHNSCVVLDYLLDSNQNLV